ncbi:ABC transporter permease subunit [Halobaculum sp. MBLA0143]|uniref:ABC transporter permease subunit n=1 Tax=Halobaculum sp. MBLA0143 TaxID=3079933 RepID=UPI003525077B
MTDEPRSGATARLRAGLAATRVVLGRELVASARSRTYGLLTLGVLAVVTGVTVVGSGVETGYVPAVVDLLRPTEVLVPAVAFAVGYRAVVDDRRRGTLAVLETYPVPGPAYVAGVYLGRLLALLVVVTVPLGLVGVAVAVTGGPASTVFASHGGVDSPALYGRFLAVTWLLAAASLAVAVAVSALAGSRRRAVVAGLLGLTVVVAGGELGLLAAVAGEAVGEGSLATALAASPTSAYRGLVFETVVAVAVERSPGGVAAGAAVVGLLAWTALGLVTATVAVARR